MENTARLSVFDTKKAIWYVAEGKSWVGPFTAYELAKKIESQEVGLADYVISKGATSWQRVCDTPTFARLTPKKPTLKEKSAPAPQVKAEKIWFLSLKSTQYGPYTEDEIRQLLSKKKVTASDYAWMHPMATWKKLCDIELFGLAKPAIERRASVRRPMVAKIYMADTRRVLVGVCRDISIGGLQVLIDPLPGDAGTHLKMNISPSGGKDFMPFVAQGEIVRILEDSRGFHFRFDELTKQAQNAIESYIRS